MVWSADLNKGEVFKADLRVQAIEHSLLVVVASIVILSFFLLCYALLVRSYDRIWCDLRVSTWKAKLMDGAQDSNNGELDGEQRRDGCSTSSPSTSGFGSIHRIIGRATDVILWKRRRVSFGVIVVATIAWLLLEKSGLSFLLICSDVLLMLTILLFLRAHYVGQLEELPELVLSEEMVNNAAASFRVKINRLLLIAHDITLGKDFRLFFVVVVCLWLLSVIGSLVSFITLAYIGTIISITIPAFYSKYEGMLSRVTGSISQRFSQHFRIVDENITGRLHHTVPNNKDD